MSYLREVDARLDPDGRLSSSALDAETVILRLEEAGRTLLALPNKGCRPADTGSGWPAVVHDFSEAYGYGEVEVRVPVPSPQAITRMDEALRWVRLIPDHRTSVRKIVLLRALLHPISERNLWSWRKIGRKFGWSHEAVRTWHAQGIDAIVAGMNSVGSSSRKN